MVKTTHPKPFGPIATISSNSCSGSGRIGLTGITPRRFTRADIEGFMSYLAGQQMTGVTRVRKLAAIRKFFTFLEENHIIAGNPANTVKGARREEKEPGILYKEQYKALLYEASDHPRDYAIIMTFLQTGIRLSELANLRVDDVDFDNKVLTVRQGKGKKDRHIPLVDEEVRALRNYLRYRASTSLSLTMRYSFWRKTARR